MFVERITYQTRLDCADELVALLQEEIALIGWHRAHRVLSPFVGTYDQVCLEIEMADMDERAAYWKRAAEVYVPERRARWQALVAPGRTDELWRLR